MGDVATLKEVAFAGHARGLGRSGAFRGRQTPGDGLRARVTLAGQVIRGTCATGKSSGSLCRGPTTPSGPPRQVTPCNLGKEGDDRLNLRFRQRHATGARFPRQLEPGGPRVLSADGRVLSFPSPRRRAAATAWARSRRPLGKRMGMLPKFYCRRAMRPGGLIGDGSSSPCTAEHAHLRPGEERRPAAVRRRRPGAGGRVVDFARPLRVLPRRQANRLTWTDLDHDIHLWGTPGDGKKMRTMPESVPATKVERGAPSLAWSPDGEDCCRWRRQGDLRCGKLETAALRLRRSAGTEAEGCAMAFARTAG